MRLRYKKDFSCPQFGFDKNAKGQVFEFENPFKLGESPNAWPQMILIKAKSKSDAQEKFDFLIDRLLDIEEKYDIDITEDITVEMCAECCTETIACVKGVTTCECGTHQLPCSFCQLVWRNKCMDECPFSDDSPVYDFTPEEIEYMYMFT